MNNDANDQKQINERFNQALHESVPDIDIEHFRRSFETAWRQRRWTDRLLTRPMLSLLLVAVTLTTAIGAGYTIVQNAAPADEALAEAPVLMPGQRVVNQPELLSLFPQVEHPTLLAMPKNSADDEQLFMVHGYMADQAIQVVWEY